MSIVNTNITRRQAVAFGMGGMSALTLAACGNSTASTEDVADEEVAEEAEEQSPDTSGATDVTPGVTVEPDEASPPATSRPLPIAT